MNESLFPLKTMLFVLFAWCSAEPKPGVPARSERIQREVRITGHLVLRRVR